MSFKNNDASIELINELSKTHAVIGYPKTLEAIKAAREERSAEELHKQRQSAIEKFILKAACTVFNISQKQVLTGKTTGTRTDCRMIIFVMAKKHLDHSQPDSAKVYGGSVTRVCRAITTYNNLKENDKHGLSIMAKANKINDMITDFKEKLNK